MTGPEPSSRRRLFKAVFWFALLHFVILQAFGGLIFMAAHIPPKAAGPAEVYDKSATTLRAWLDAKILVRETRTAFYPYMQTYDHAGRTGVKS